MRDRLIALLREPMPTIKGYATVGETRMSIVDAEHIADRLLANGVIVPSNKSLPLIDEGDRVLCPICETDLMGCYFGYEESPTVVTCYGCGAWLDSTKAVDREEAEKALERSE